MTEFPFDPEIIASEIDIPLEVWPGNCFGIAEAILRKMPVRGMRMARGHYTGRISRDSVYPGDVAQHSWLVLEDGRILDPTRWAMESPKTPRIYLGDAEDYDEGGMVLKTRSRAYARAHSFTSFRAQNGPEAHVMKVLKTSPHARELVLATGGGLSEIASERNVDRVMNAINDPVEHLRDPIRVYQAIVDAGLGAMLQFDQRQRVLDPEAVTPDRGANFFYEIPPMEESTPMQKLFRVITKFLSIEKMDMRLESELENHGYSLEEFHDGLNFLERYLEWDPDLKRIPGNAGSMISIMIFDHLGSGFGAQMEVEAYARSVGLDRQELHHALERFGELAGYDLAWLSPDEVHEKVREHEEPCGP